MTPSSIKRPPIVRPFALAAAAFLAFAADTPARDVQLARGGNPRCVVVAPVDWAKEAGDLPKELPPQAAILIKERRQLHRDSIRDLALYLSKISGTQVEITEGLLAGEKRTPIFVGEEARKRFGSPGEETGAFGAFRMVAGARGVGLFGASEHGTSYAIYELLHRLGCRWFMPTELGEVVPSMPDLSVPEMDEKRAPAAAIRSMWQGGTDFLRRNRMGRNAGEIAWLADGDGALERFFTAQDLEAHPEWRAQLAEGKPHPHALRLTHPGVAEHVASKMLTQLDSVSGLLRDAGLRPGYRLIPGDFQVPTEDPYERPSDPVPRVWEPAAGRWSVTDRCMLLQNRVAERVRSKYPEVAFGDLAYVNKMLPPAKQPVPKDFHITIAPIDFNRHHPMDWPNHPNEYWLRDLVQGWSKSGALLSAYWYGINLAEISAPCPFITKWGTDIRVLLQNGLQNWTPETMNGWDSMLPGYVLASRLTFYPDEKPEAILQDLWTKFYGAAAEPMARYWTGIDRAYLEAREYAGSPFGYLKIFTPEVMASARADLQASLAACRTPVEYRRVKLIDESFNLFELYMKMRTAWATANLRTLADDYVAWRGGVLDMMRRYQDPADRTYVQGRHGNPAWSDSSYSLGYKEGARMEREYVRLGKPMLEWKWKHNPGAEADSLPWTETSFEDKEWPLTHVVRDTWSSLGHHFTLTDAASGRSGRMAYRVTQKLPALPSGKKALLWIGSTDGSAKLFVNGKHVPYVVPEKTPSSEKGDVLDAFSGYCKPAQFDVTEFLVNGVNQFTVLCDRYHLNELGTGGLMGPVVLYREK